MGKILLVKIVNNDILIASCDSLNHPLAATSVKTKSLFIVLLWLATPRMPFVWKKLKLS